MQFTRPFLSLVKVGLACESSTRLAYYLLLHLQKYLTFLECAHFTKGISSALSAISNILHSSGSPFDYHTTAYIVVANLGSWERGYAICNSTCKGLYSLWHVPGSFKISCSKLDIKIEPSPVGSRVELHPLAHAQFASWNSAQRLSPKKGASD